MDKMNQVYIVQSQVNLSNKTLRAILNNIIRPSIIETQNQTPNTVVSDPIVGHTTQYPIFVQVLGVNLVLFMGPIALDKIQTRKFGRLSKTETERDSFKRNSIVG